MFSTFLQPQCAFVNTDNLTTLTNCGLYLGIADILQYELICDLEFLYDLKRIWIGLQNMILVFSTMLLIM